MHIELSTAPAGHCESLRDDQIKLIADIAMREAGFRIDSGKREFLKMRLNRRLAATGVDGYRSYLERLQQDASERVAFVEALTVHTTNFFRENHQYDWLREWGFPELVKDNQDITIWSAAASSGQEGWSALITAAEFCRTTSQSLNYSLVGTDVSTQILKRAEEAIYFADEMASLPGDLRPLYFLKSRQDDGRYRVVPELRKRAQWRKANLATGEGIGQISCHIAFLRNILIYFDKSTQNAVVDSIVKKIVPGGYLMTGHSETGFRHAALTQIKPSIYQKA